MRVSKSYLFDFQVDFSSCNIYVSGKFIYNNYGLLEKLKIKHN